MGLIRAVVFDLFHTLVDPELFRPSEFRRLPEAARLLGLDPSVVEARWAEIVDVVAVTMARPADLLAEACPEPPPPEVVAAVDEALGRYQDLGLAHPLPGAIETVDALRTAGLAVGLLSNAHERDVRMWESSPLADRFDAVVISCRDGVRKPDAAAYQRVLADLGVPAREAAFVGDGNGGELAGARAAGFGMVIIVTGPAIRSGFRTREELAAIGRDADASVSEVGGVPALLGARRP